MNNIEATKKVFDFIKEEYNGTATDVEYLNPYDVADGHIVRFYLDICPGWLFAIEWNMDDYPNMEYAKKGLLYTQYELMIDKFKPSHSAMQSEVDIIYANKTFGMDEDSVEIDVDIIDCIKKRPELAFYYDMHFDFDRLDYISKGRAKRYMRRQLNYHYREEGRNRFLTKYIMFGLKKYLDKYLPGAYFLDNGECCSPRYELFIPNKYFEEGELQVPENHPEVYAYCYGLHNMNGVSNKYVEKVAKRITKRIKAVEFFVHHILHVWRIEEVSDACMIGNRYVSCEEAEADAEAEECAAALAKEY